MSSQVHSQRESMRCGLSGDLTIYAAAEMKPRLCEVLSQRSRVLFLDLSEVGDCDTAGVQLLLGAWRAAGAAGREFAVVEPSDAVRDALSLLGLRGLIRETHGFDERGMS